jgi:vacuolar-type H+-ATPase subunit H
MFVLFQRNPGVIMSENSAIQRIKELDQERAALFEQAKEEALRRANQAVEDLNALGLKYRLISNTAADQNKSAGKGKAQETGTPGADKKRPVRSP